MYLGVAERGYSVTMRTGKLATPDSYGQKKYIVLYLQHVDSFVYCPVSSDRDEQHLTAFGAKAQYITTITPPNETQAKIFLQEIEKFHRMYNPNIRSTKNETHNHQHS